MGKSIPAFEDPLIIRYRGTYDYDGIMTLIRKFFSEYYFENITEPKFKFKYSGDSAEMDIRIKAFRLVSHYIKVTLQIDGHTWGTKRKTIKIDGKKKVVTDGKIQLFLNATVEFDYSNMFDTEKRKVKNPDKFLLEWMHTRLDNDWKGMQYGQNYSDGITFVRSIILDIDRRIKKHLRMECV